MRVIEAAPISAARFAPYGVVIDAQAAAPEAINEGTTMRHPDLAALDVLGPGRDPVLGIYVAQARAFPLRIAALERHREASQTFLALGPQRFVVVVARGVEAPRWEGIEAFVTAPGQGVSLKRGCWHHGLVALNDGDRFAVIEGAHYRADTEVVAVPHALELAAPPVLR